MKQQTLNILLLVLLSFQLTYANSINDAIRKATQKQESSPDSCIDLSQKILTQLTDEQVKEKAQVYWNLAQGYLYKHQYHTALFYGLKGEELLKNDNESFIYQDIMATLGWVYYDIGNPAQAIPYHRKALEAAQRRNDFESEIRYTNALGLDASAAKLFDKGLNYFMKAKFLIEQSGKPHLRLQSMLDNNIGMIYIEYENWDKAEASLRNSIKNSTGKATSLLESYALLAQVTLNKKQLEETKKLLDLCEELSHKTTYSFSLLEYYKVRIDYEELIGYYKEAYLFQKKYLTLHNKVDNEGVQEVMNYLLNVQEQKLAQDQLLIEQAKTIEGKRYQLAVVGVLLMILIVGIFYYVFRSRAEREVLKQELLQKELAAKQKEKEELNNELAFKNEKLETLALNLNQRNELIDALSEQIKENSSKEVREGWNNFMNVIQQSHKTHEISDKVVQSFRYRLQEKFPSLTEKDQQLVMDIRNNLSSKEIADKYHVAVKSVEMSRYRLRKKLNIEKGTHLKDFIMEI
ncbi:LuxR C-terminal-related transcriptional regulator [Flammeovirga sp. SubArs3]|uniref:tetratricopeptide repeat protein n=1 Tax=Flammeovirga sp. SubArs3 TaxID=2995316 RepID=UPI00248AD021|nr:LuxR C-terminal-related transcriptional regulator [Flammeovirga sp. SubArs3]